jgi:hypothetical protein
MDSVVVHAFIMQLFVSQPAAAAASPREQLSPDENWRFHLDDPTL